MFTRDLRRGTVAPRSDTAGAALSTNVAEKRLNRSVTMATQIPAPQNLRGRKDVWSGIDACEN